ncbi:MAG: GHMP kinase [Lentisphaerae bacterium]|jgi:glucuronokinase|nr:GHMP kinase [Lentisphaerota bacterium]MBT4814295.1 GHMP kinase [Lentisphaerota bacterium]MBT5609124.1 GHMP kinase [Lentisphaerota bacterium]MBT7058433.1 GHMP kinase [Lentisphaerota bacterium]MBT7840349.1 GHMP kinase [Lentisphaerota bacterium]
MLLTTTSHARAGLLGNPSDGYFGKTIAFAFGDFAVTVTMYESPELQLVPGVVDDSIFADVDALISEVNRFGYYGGIRLLKATIRVFVEYCQEHGIALPPRNFTARYTSSIPRLVGLGGSSAICTAMFRSLMAFYEVDIPLEMIPTLCWQAERRELGIHCGLQDRVIQMYGGTVFMDFEEKAFTTEGHGRYVPVDVSALPSIYLAYDPERAEFSGKYHSRLHVLFEENRADIVSAMAEFADLAQQGFDLLRAGKTEGIPELINANFDLRNRVFSVREENAHMVFQARKSGASAKFAGSGGAIVGTYEDEEMYSQLVSDLDQIGCSVIRPRISPAIVVPAAAS